MVWLELMKCLNQAGNPDNMTDEELINHIVEAEWDDRQNKKLLRLIKSAKFRYQACVEEITFTPDRNLDKNTF